MIASISLANLNIRCFCPLLLPFGKSCLPSLTFSLNTYYSSTTVMAPFRNCGMEALDIDLAPPGDPKAHAGANDILHDLRQGLVSPSTRPQTIERQQTKGAPQTSGSIYPKVPLRRVGATRVKRPRPAALHRSQSRPSAAGDIPQAPTCQSQPTSTSSLAQPNYTKLSRRQLFIELLQVLCCLPIYRENTQPYLRSAPSGFAQKAP